MGIYTRNGDRGETGLPGGSRVAKDAALLEACGTIDELGAVLGIVRAEPLPEQLDRLLLRLQHELSTAAVELAAGPPASTQIPTLGPQHVRAVEEAIDRHEATLPPLGEFILSAGTRPAAALHLARTVCRRAERRLVTVTRTGEKEISGHLTAYLNRLSDLLFVLARAVNAQAGIADAVWKKSGG